MILRGLGIFAGYLDPKPEWVGHWFNQDFRSQAPPPKKFSRIDRNGMLALGLRNGAGARALATAHRSIHGTIPQPKSDTFSLMII